MDLKPGLEGHAELTVGEGDCAIAMGSGALRVLATPRLLALMEEAACAAIAPALGPAQTTVGVRIELDHVAATPPGLRVRARAILERVEGRALHFALSAEDEREPIGRGRHQRVLVDAARFLEKANGKRVMNRRTAEPP
jgi:predicted thioesterase